MLYPPTPKADILKRAAAGAMCLREPLCWKQLDWRTTDPPEWTCPQSQSRRLYEMSYHTGAMAGASTLIEKSLNEVSATGTRHEVFLCSSKHAAYSTANYHYPFKHCDYTGVNSALNGRWTTLASTSRATTIFNAFKSKAHFRDVDALMFSFGSAEWEHWMGFNKTLILHLCHRVNQYRCSYAESVNTFINVRRLASSGPGGSLPGGPRHIIGADTIYDQEYIRHYTGVRPILLGTTMVDALRSTNHATRRTKSSDRIACYADYTTEPLSISSICCGQSGKHNSKDLDRSKSCPSWRRQCQGYTANARMGVCVATNADSKPPAADAQPSEILWNAHIPPPPELMDGKSKAPWNAKAFRFVTPTWKGRYETRDLAKYRAVVYIPYSVSNFESVEHRALNVPMFVPDVKFAVQFSIDRTETYGPYCSFTDSQHPGAHVDSPYEFSPNVRDGAGAEFWLGFSEIYQWPCTKIFSSWAHLNELLMTADLVKMRKCNEQANKWMRFELVQNWCWAFGEMGPGKRDFPSSYSAATQELYGTTAIPTA